MQGKMHHIRSLTPPQAAGNALAMHVQPSNNKGKGLSAKEQFKSDITRWAAIMKVNPVQIRVQIMKKKWASCSAKGRICFSTDLLKESRTFQEYVIIHELLHLQVPNHGKLFKSLMNAYLPGWETVVAARNGDTTRSL
ncbi:MAG: M48 family metallopeptidase [Desulfovibrionales bacterium]|nr:M48 family metallopeptidase [Desulfovibrionales bacterium]